MVKIIKINDKRFSKLRLGIIVGIIIILGGVIITWLLISEKISTETKIAKRAENIEQTAGDAQKLAFSGNPDDAKVAFDDAVSVTEDPYERSILLMGKAAIFFDENKYDEALTVAKDAEIANQNAAVTSFIAQIYEKKGDKQKAIEYYQKTIGLVDQSSPLAKSDIQRYQEKIKLLGATEN